MPDGDAYQAFLAGKVPAPPAAGRAVVPPLHPVAGSLLDRMGVEAEAR